ncbi:hypothetical protein HOP50_15g74990 [Chloropicon primus]|uniref:Leucine-rich repeat-containing protein 56 n=1 Tax=Chloropicon primus TaxID=1764295 RepID=A0A5B8MXV2_9CHLO|nr:hypothetical protein A3770_15p74740 [Chloropicon primus]UPR04165.1 hypothetical protein HOP50_15g74990 [Chloropicon primus]|eukprot:QDZ24956.1 hypothetical protein A3770_15p74740 [Chloropicon primus]
MEKGEGEVQQLEMQVDSEEYNLTIAGEKLPNIQRLKLNESKIHSIRDLGTGWKNLKVLWLSRCGLEDLHGMTALPNLTELYVSFNDVCDITPLADLENIQVIDLESNRIEDLDSVGYLGFCRDLVQLTLEGNPVSNEAGYRAKVVSHVPQLLSLDDLPVTERDRAPVLEDDEREETSSDDGDRVTGKEDGQRRGSQGGGTDASSTCDRENSSTGSSVSSSIKDDLEAELKRLESAELALISDGIKYTRMEPKEAPLCYYGNDALTLEDMFRNFNENLPIHRRKLSARPSSALGFRQGDAPSVFSPRSRRGSMIRPSTAMGGPRAILQKQKMGGPGRQHDDHVEDVGSNLTRGGDCSLAGNAAKALLQRKSQQAPETAGSGPHDEMMTESEPSSGSGLSHKGHSREGSAEMDMLEELKKWKLSNNDAFGSFSEEDERVTYQCLNLEDGNNKKPGVETNDNNVVRPKVPPRIKQLKSVVIRDENVPVKVNRSTTVVETKTVSSYSATMMDQYNQYQDGQAVEDYQSLSFDAPMPPRPGSSKGVQRGGFQRKTIVRSNSVKVDKKSLVAARMDRMKRFSSCKTKEGMQGLQDKIIDGAENW